MHIELTESLVCPLCHPGQGLVALVEEISERRIRRGALGCPACERRYPIVGGHVRFEAPVGGGEEASDRAPSRDAAVTVAALLGLEERDEGIVLLGAGLAGLASEVAGLAPSVEVVALAPSGGASPEPSRPGPTRFHGVAEGRLPFVSGRLRGVALRGGDPAGVREAARALARRGRLAVLRPTAAVSDLLASEGGAEGLEILASEERAAVAVRR